MEEVENGECYEYDEEGHAMCNGAKRKYIRFFGTSSVFPGFFRFGPKRYRKGSPISGAPRKILRLLHIQPFSFSPSLPPFYVLSFLQIPFLTVASHDTHGPFPTKILIERILNRPRLLPTDPMIDPTKNARKKKNTKMGSGEGFSLFFVFSLPLPHFPYAQPGKMKEEEERRRRRRKGAHFHVRTHSPLPQNPGTGKNPSFPSSHPLTSSFPVLLLLKGQVRNFTWMKKSWGIEQCHGGLRTVFVVVLVSYFFEAK